MANNRQRGAVLNLEKTWQLAQLWYGDRMATDFRGRTLDSAQVIFKQVGLTKNFWKAE
jgi:hypothetical protein